MKKLLFFLIFFLSTTQITAAWNDLPDRPIHSKYMGQYFAQAGFLFGSTAMLSCVYDKYGLGFSLGCIGVGAFLLSPLAEEVFNPQYKINISNIYKFKKLLPCGLSGFACLTIGLKALKDLK